MYLVLALEPLVLPLQPAQVLDHLERVGVGRGPGGVGLPHPIRQAARVAAQPARRLGVRGARFPVQLHGLLLEFRRVPGRWIAMARLAFLRCGHHAETEIDLSTDLGQIHFLLGLKPALGLFLDSPVQSL